MLLDFLFINISVRQRTCLECPRGREAVCEDRKREAVCEDRKTDTFACNTVLLNRHIRSRRIHKRNVMGNFRATFGSEVVDGKQSTKSDTER